MNEVFVVPFIVFMVFVAPIWLWLHYREKQRERDIAAGKNLAQGAPSAEPPSNMAEVAARLEQRIEALEALLDTESPDWRKRRE